MKPQRVEISYKTIVFTTLFILGLGLLWLIKDILALLFVCLIIMEALNPTIVRFEKAKFPRPVAIILVYIMVISVFGFALAGLVPLLVNQTSELLRILPNTLQGVQVFGLSAIDLSSQFKLLESIPSEIAKTVVALFSNIFSGFVILVITFYLLIERQHLSTHSSKITGTNGQHLIANVFDQLESRLGSWVNGEIILMTAIGLLSYLGYQILGLSYAIPLALIAGLLEIVPNIGPIIATALAALVGLTISPLTAVFTIVWGIVIQQIENNFLVPKIMKEAVGLNPVITILTIATGAKLGGVGGALLAVPIYLTIETIATALWKNKK